MPEDGNTDRWMEVAKWAGESEAAIKGLNKEISGLRKDIKAIDRKIEKMNSRLTSTQVKLGTLSGTIALIVTLVTVLISNRLGM